LIASENTNSTKREDYKINHEKKTFQDKRKMEMVLGMTTSKAGQM